MTVLPTALDDPAARGTVAALLRHPFWLDATAKLERVLPYSISYSISFLILVRILILITIIVL